MIRIRTESGDFVEVEQPLKHVEITDKEGNVAMVFTLEDCRGMPYVSVIHPGHPDDMKSYSRKFGVKFSEKVQGEWPGLTETKVSA
jgi:hypothetical protein